MTRSTYLYTAAAPLFSLLFAAAFLPETNPEIKDGWPSKQNGQSSEGAVAKSGKKSAYATLLLDPECFLIGGALGLYEFLNYAPMNSVAILFMKDWVALQGSQLESHITGI